MIKRLLSVPSNRSFFLFGPRQTGKSTFLREEVADNSTITLNLLESDTFLRYSAHPELFRKEIENAFQNAGKKRIIVDEIQKIPPLLDEIHSLIESYSQIQFCLSGSSSRKLKRTHANLLAGRAASRRMHPLTYLETGADFNLDRALQFGTLPPVMITQDTADKIDILESYCDVYLKEEIQLEAQVRNLGGFIRFLQLLAAENGEQINMSNVARETMLSLSMVKQYYQIMEDTLLGFILFPYTESMRKKISRHPKFYLFDTGVRRAFEHKLRTPLIDATEDYGRAFEHFIILEIFRLNDYLRLDCTLSFYRTESGVEVDCIIKSPQGKEVAVEIKATTAPTSVHCRGLRSFADDKPSAERYLVCRSPRPYTIGDIKVLPWQDFLGNLKEIMLSTTASL